VTDARPTFDSLTTISASVGGACARPGVGARANRECRLHDRDTMWRTLEWSFVMGALSWLFVRLWTDAIYGPRRARVAPGRLRRLLPGGWLRTAREGRGSGSGAKPGAGDAG
jgi:hypothetical protein